MTIVGRIRSSTFIIIFIILAESSIAQNSNLSIKITQYSLPYGKIYIYNLDNRKLRVYSEEGYNDVKLECKIRLTNNTLDSLKTLTKYIVLQNYKSSYSSECWDGVIWDFEIEINSDKKVYKLSNYYLEPFDSLILLINKTLPKEYQFIRIYKMNY